MHNHSTTNKRACANPEMTLHGTYPQDSPVAEVAAEEDPAILASKPPYGAFMLGFDFHLTAAGPKLIEINTNAGGLATVFHLSGCPEEKAMMTAQFQQVVGWVGVQVNSRPVEPQLLC